MNIKLLKRTEVENRTGLSRSSIYDAMSKGNFPRPIKLGSRAVRWPESDINSWIQEQIDRSKGGSNER